MRLRQTVRDLRQQMQHLRRAAACIAVQHSGHTVEAGTMDASMAAGCGGLGVTMPVRQLHMLHCVSARAQKPLRLLHASCDSPVRLLAMQGAEQGHTVPVCWYDMLAHQQGVALLRKCYSCVILASLHETCICARIICRTVCDDELLSSPSETATHHSPWCSAQMQMLALCLQSILHIWCSS